MESVEIIISWAFLGVAIIWMLFRFISWIKDNKDNPYKIADYIICASLYLLSLCAAVGNLYLISQVENWFFRLILTIYGILSFYVFFNWLSTHLG